jgi:polysaccharide biosynthesis protein PslH
VRILFCVTQAPLPPYNGFQLAIAGLVDALCRAGHEVAVVALMPHPSRQHEAEDYDIVPVQPPRGGPIGDAVDLARMLLLGEPMRVGRLTQKVRPVLRRAVEAFDPDVVHVSPGPLAGLDPHEYDRPTVLACFDAWHHYLEARLLVASNPLRRQYLRLSRRLVARFESREYGKFDNVTAVTEEDAAALRAVCPELDVRPVPNGVDLEPLHGPPVRQRAARLLFHGVLSYAPNVTAAGFLCRDVLPLVRREIPGARLSLVGRQPSPAVAELADLPGVEVTGEVPSLEPAMSAARVYVCPMLSGTGIKNKLLEAFAYGLPSVATPLALQGLDVVAGRDVLVGEDAHELAAHVLSLLRDDDLAERVGAAGRRYVDANHHWDAVARRYLSLYVEAIAQHGDVGR